MKFNVLVLFIMLLAGSNLWAADDVPVGMPVTRSDIPEYLLVEETQVEVEETRDLEEVEALTPERTQPPVRTTTAPEDITEEIREDGNTVTLDAQEMTPEERARRQALEDERVANERAQVAAREQAERIAERRREEEAEGRTCERDKQNLIGHQRRIFDLESPQGNKLLELLKRQDDLKARVSTFQTLLNIWKDYQGFLSSNESLVNGSLQSPASAQEALSKLDELEKFISENQEPVERYNVASEVLNSLPDRQAIRALGSDEEKLEYIVSAMESRCNELGTNSDSLYMCGIDIRQSVRLEPQINRNPTNRAELINKFVNTAINIDDADFVFGLNFSSLFVDDERHTNLTGRPEFAATMKSIIQKSKDYCRHQVLLEESENIRCLQAPLSEVLGSELGNAQEQVINRLQALNGGSGAINNVGDLTQSYLQMARRTKNLHEEMTGGTIRELGAISENIENLQQQFQSAEEALTNPATVRALRTQFKNLTKEKILNLGSSLNHNEFQRNQEIYKKYSEGHPNLLSGSNRLNFEKDGQENKATFANKIVEDILCSQTTGSCPIAGGIFTQNGDELALNQDNVIEIFNNLMESAGGVNALKDILGEEREQGLKDELSRVNNEIAAIKNGSDYKSLNAFKNFIWGQAKESCMKGEEDDVLVHRGSSCVIAGNIQTGLNDFLEVGGEFLSFQNRNEARSSLEDLQQSCTAIHSRDSGVYQREYVDTGICPAVFEERRRIDRENINRAQNARNSPSSHDPNIIYEYDSQGKVVGRHVPNSNLAIFLPQAAYTVNEQLPFYFVQRPGMNMAIENWRQMGFQQKTAQAYWDAQRQSWLNNTTCGAFGCYFNSTMLEGASPTFGNFGFSFGSTTTVPTTFNTGVNTIPTTSNGFGF